MAKSLKQSTISGMVWSTIQKFGTLIISFIANLVLARLLSPEDFGAIGMLMVFLSIADTLINGGFASALIQKKEPTKYDYTTVFYWNLVASLLLYIVLYFSSPSIAKFYDIPILNDLLRVQGLVLLLNAFNTVQINKLIKGLNFRKLARVNISSTIVGAIVGIFLAFHGFGVWSLVIKMLIASAVQCVILWVGDNWRPSASFSWISFKELFNFGSLLLLSNLSQTIIYHLQSLIIGRMYTAQDLGFYTQAKNLNQIPERAMPQIVDQVMFPVYSALQDDKEKVTAALRKSLKSLAYITFPLMALMAIIAEPLILLLFTDKWIESVPYFQIFCVGSMLFTLNSNNLNVVKSLGRSDYILKLTLMKRAVTIIFIVIGLQFGIKGIAIAYTLSMYVWYPMNVYYSKKLIGYGLFDQLRDIGLNYLLAILVAIITFVISRNFELHYVIELILICVIFSVLYIMGTWILKIDSYKTYTEIIKSNFEVKR